MKKVLVKLAIFSIFAGMLVFANKTSASVGEIMKLEASATKVKFNDPLTLTWDIQPALLTSGMKCVDWDGELITEAKGSKTIPHIRHLNRFQIGCSKVTETATNAVATAHASNMIEIEIDTSEPVVLSETPSFDSSKIDDDVTLELKMGNKTYKLGRQGVVGSSGYKTIYIDTPETSGTISWKYDSAEFADCFFAGTELGKYIRDNVYEEVHVGTSVPGLPQFDMKTKRTKPEGQAPFDLTKDKNIIMTCYSSNNVVVYKQKTANMQIMFYNIEGGSNAPTETPSTDLSKSSDALKMTMKAGDKTYKISGPAFDYKYDTANQVLTSANMGIFNVSTKSKDATLEWQADPNVFKYCQRDGSYDWPLADLSLSGSQNVRLDATNLFQITCTSGDKASLYSGESKMARVYILANATSGLTIIKDDSGQQVVVDEEDIIVNDNKNNNQNDSLNNDEETTTNTTTTDPTTTTWKDYSSMLEMPKVTVDSGMPVCTTVPDEKFHGCYYKGKIDDQINIPDQSLILGGETVVGNRIDHDWGTEKIISGLDGVSYTDNISAIWKGKFYFGEGDYLFKATADDGVKVIVDDTSNVIYKWYPQPRNTHISDLTHLTEGYHTVTVRYYEQGHKAAVKVWWEHQKPAIEAEALSAELSTFQKLIEQLRDLVQKVLNFFGVA
jgi:hypothetical protein